MPEGPEVRRAADRLTRAIAGEPLVEVKFGMARLQQFADELRASKVTAVQTRGKAMLTRFECGLTMYSHNQLYGRWLVQRAGPDPVTRRSLRVGLYTQSRAALLYSASDIDVVENSAVESIPFLQKLGPDCLNEQLRACDVSRRLVSPRFRGRRLAHLLLDQAFLAGVGNYLRSEILFFAGLHPHRRPATLAPAERRALARALLEVPRRAYRTGGITLDSGTARRLKSDGWTRRRYRHAVFRRGGQCCHSCGQAIVDGELSARRLSWCPRCQPE